MLRAARDGGVGEVHRTAQVVHKVLGRVLHRLADERKGGEVHHRVEAALPAQRDDPVAVGKVSFDELRAGIDRVAVAGYERVEDRDLVAHVEKILHTGAADVSGSAGYQYVFHKTVPPMLLAYGEIYHLTRRKTIPGVQECDSQIT